MMRKLILLAMLVPAIGIAEHAPPPGKFDPRVRTVAYNPQDLVVVTTYYGVSTPIRFADDEVIEKESLDAGDRKAWAIKASARGNILFVRPIAERADTNVTVVTNKRVYLFLLKVVGDKAQAKKKDSAFAPTYSMATARSKDVTYSLTFTYSEDGKKTEGQKAADALRAQTAGGRKRATNTDYWVAGDGEVAPVDARDDGRFIYLTFAGNQGLPTISSVDANGKETLLNPAVDGNTVIVDRMVPRLALRKGDGDDGLVACVVNRAFDRKGGADTKSGTVAPNVLRVIKGGKK
jgi:type IV secretion system protein VirB9